MRKGLRRYLDRRQKPHEKSRHAIRDPVARTTFGKGYRKPEKFKFMAPREVRRLVDAATALGNPWARLAFELAFYLGLREGEVADLRGTDFDLDKGIAWIRTLKRKQSAAARRLPYWQRGEADRPALPVRIPASAEARRAATWAVSTARRNAERFVFQKVPGRPVSTGLLRRWFREARRKAGLDERYTFHSLRHAHATLVAAATRDPIVVRDQLRHQSVKMTDRYMRAARDYSQEIGPVLTLKAPAPKESP